MCTDQVIEDKWSFFFIVVVQDTKGYREILKRPKHGSNYIHSG